MALKRIDPPVDYPVTLQEAQDHLHVDSADDADYIQSLIAAATDHVDGKYGVLQRAILPQAWQLTYDEFPCDGESIEIPLPPLISVDSVSYLDNDGIEQIIDSANYYVDIESSPGWIVPIENYSWPTPLEAANAVRIIFRAGHVADASGDNGVPPSIKQAILLIIGDWYKNREDRPLLSGPHVNIPTAAKALLDQHRIPALA